MRHSEPNTNADIKNMFSEVMQIAEILHYGPKEIYRYIYIFSIYIYMYIYIFEFESFFFLDGNVKKI